MSNPASQSPSHDAPTVCEGRSCVLSLPSWQARITLLLIASVVASVFATHIRTPAASTTVIRSVLFGLALLAGISSTWSA
jgi:hypothetical protein